MTFGDIPFYFSREEWGSLDPAQRDLFWDIKRESSRDAALGKQWTQPGPWCPWLLWLRATASLEVLAAESGPRQATHPCVSCWNARSSFPRPLAGSAVRFPGICSGALGDFFFVSCSFFSDHKRV